MILPRSIRRTVLTVLITLCLVVGVCFVFRQAAYSDRRFPQAPTVVVVPHGATTNEIAILLARRHVVNSSFVFAFLARIQHQAGRLQAGQFRIDAHQSVADVLSALAEGHGQLAVWVTFPEGYTASQIAHLLAEHRLGDERTYDRIFFHQTLAVAGARTRSLEGTLFPSTYLIPLGSSPQAVTRELTDTFTARLPADARTQAHRLGLSVPQILTLASLIEREAKIDAERPLMAGVYYNRLRLHMPLQVDASIEYIFPEHKTVITQADLAIDSLYNTYLHAGLPPTPIANPGLPSIQAAFHPQTSAFLYYVAKGDGHHAFARTLAEHNSNVARYEP